MLGRTLGAVVAVVAVVVLWVVCLRMLLGYAGSNDPGAYVIVGGVFLMLPAAAVLLIVAISRERRGYWNTAPCEHGCRTSEEWRTNHATAELEVDAA